MLSTTEQELLFGLFMAAGLVGVLVPVIPGLLVVAVTAVAWAWWHGGVTAWTVTAVMLVILALGTVAKYVLPGRSLKEGGAPTSTLLVAAAFAVVGFFVIPVVGVVVGGVAGVWIAELRRLSSLAAANRSTWATLKAIGVGILLELTAGVVAVVIWAIAALSLHS